MPDVNVVAEHIMQLLKSAEPESFVTNRTLRVLTSRRLGQDISSETYFSALASLSVLGRIDRRRGQGGQVGLSLLENQLAPETLPQTASYWTEPRLMSCLAKYLNNYMWRELDLPDGEGGEWMVIDTSVSGPRKGKWARPDFTVVSIMTYEVLPTQSLDIYSFELKAEPACNLTSIHEALAQTRMTNYGYLVWHVSEGSAREIDIPEIVSHCRSHGIGLIRIRDPYESGNWSIELFAQRKETPLIRVDAFLSSSRLSDDQRIVIRKKLSRSN